MLVIGLTGSVGTGKSTVAALLKAYGARVIDTDRIVHRELRTGGKCVSRIGRVFGASVISPNGSVRRKKLAEIVFFDQAKLRQLEKIIHPVVRQEVLRKIKEYRDGKKTKVVVVEVPLLFESGFDKLVDHTVVVTARQETQISRAQKRLNNISRAQILNRINAQMPLKQKIQLADFRIDNDSDLIKTKGKVAQIWEKLSQKVKK